MTNEQKMEIATLANQYISEKKLTAADFSRVTKVNQSYMSNILNGVFVASSGESTVDIADKYFVMIADVVSYKVKKSYWPHVNTREFKEMITIMQEAKETQVVKTLVVETGAGKSYAVQLFKRIAPLHTYIVTMHSMMKISDVFNELCSQLGIPDKGTKGYKRAQVIIKLRDLRRNGGKPVIVIDEGENMNMEMMRMVKGLYDAVLGFASVVMLGTEQLWDLMKAAKVSDKQGGPQYFRRFKAGTKQIKIQQNSGDRYKPFFEATGVTDKSFRALLCELCDNYGELHDYLEPALRMADADGLVLTEQYFRVMYDMPKAA
jgi:hypothetical protein